MWKDAPFKVDYCKLWETNVLLLIAATYSDDGRKKGGQGEQGDG